MNHRPLPSNALFSVPAAAATGLLLFALTVSQGVTPPKSVADEPSADKASESDKPTEAVATLAGGCFWCTEAVFERIDGVNDVVSGYIGGTDPNPNYKKVCTGQTGHAEAVEVYYDPNKRSYEEILKIFFKTHDPTSLNKQGYDEGTQYRSAIFYHDEAEKKAAEKFIEKLNKSGEYNRPIVTTLEKAEKFFPAEEYHQDYYRRNPTAGYCKAVVRNKVRKTNREFGDMLKK
ncbi:peptide-methionine (S)-S-oxide reductase MsrA [Novipirellula caenicola]|uniref:Peptide methionine sulfoxide reductase MsrA n=1 Tax=Novipirellula caenicola TaxID=1536901 RepID=A0ABP9VYB0_9BACT